MSTNYGNTGAVITDLSTSGVAMFASMDALPLTGTLDSISIRRGTTAGTVQPRLALYKGGTVTDPTGATLVRDFGQLTGTTPSALETYTAGNEALTAGDILHVFIKMGSSATSVGVTNSNGAGDFHTQDMGSCLNGQVANSPTTAFPASISGINGLDQGIQTPCVYITYTTAAVPALTSPTGTATGASTATGTVATDTANGTLYAVVTSSATKPTAAQVKSGLNSSGTSAIWGGSQAVSATGTKTVNASGLTTGIQQYFHYMHENATGGQSTVATSSAFTPAGTASLATVSADNIVLLGETGAKAIGANFGDTTGTASIVAAGVTQAQTITGWSSATAVFSFAQGNLPYGSATFQLITGG